jgi:hypothetical protein
MYECICRCLFRIVILVYEYEPDNDLQYICQKQKSLGNVIKFGHHIFLKVTRKY